MNSMGIYLVRIKILIGWISLIALFLSCNGNRISDDFDEQNVKSEVRQMLHNYYTDVNREGLTAEFIYLDNSPDFFWNPPGYSSPLSYDSVRAEVERNAMQFQSVQFRWDTLQVHPLTSNVASFTGKATGELTDTTGVETHVVLLESGNAIRRAGEWKILNGHTTVLENQTETNGIKSKKVTGIGGIFFKSENPLQLKEWYNKHLGLDTDQWGTNFEWRQGADPNKKGFTQWSPFSENTSYFKPSDKDFMINYRVQNLEALVEGLRKERVTILDEIETYDYGKFIHILDLEGNKVELWEPNDVEYDKIVDGRTK